jgi:hypothetical protein
MEKFYVRILMECWSGLVWSGLVWSALVWSGLVWSGLVWSGLLWSGLVWSGLVWSLTIDNEFMKRVLSFTDTDFFQNCPILNTFYIQETEICQRTFMPIRNRP